MRRLQAETEGYRFPAPAHGVTNYLANLSFPRGTSFFLALDSPLAISIER